MVGMGRVGFLVLDQSCLFMLHLLRLVQVCLYIERVLFAKHSDFYASSMRGKIYFKENVSNISIDQIHIYHLIFIQTVSIFNCFQLFMHYTYQYVTYANTLMHLKLNTIFIKHFISLYVHGGHGSCGFYSIRLVMFVHGTPFKIGASLSIY